MKKQHLYTGIPVLTLALAIGITAAACDMVTIPKAVEAPVYIFDNETLRLREWKGSANLSAGYYARQSGKTRFIIKEGKLSFILPVPEYDSLAEEPVTGAKTCRLSDTIDNRDYRLVYKTPDHASIFSGGMYYAKDYSAGGVDYKAGWNFLFETDGLEQPELSRDLNRSGYYWIIEEKER
jgi:hypothetical protein